MNAYLHIPFCRSFCSYCDFTSFADCDALIPAYALALCSEIARSNLQGPLKTVYFGGGTPSLLGPPRVRRILEALREKAGFADGLEISLEANPDTVDLPALKGYREAGVNRLSLGAQTSDASLLKLLSRRHDWGRVEEAVRDARQAAFTNVNLDLMIGLPGQTIPMVQKTLRDAIRLEPDHLSVYALEVMAGTPLEKTIRAGMSPPADDETADAYECAQRILHDAGFEQYEVSNFCRPGFACVHNLAVWQGEDYWGFGVAAVGTQGALRRTNGEDLDEYLRRAADGQEPAASREEIPPRARAFERIMLKLRTRQGAPPEEIEEYLSGSPRAVRERLDEFLREGWLVLENGRYRPTSTGFFRLNGMLLGLLP